MPWPPEPFPDLADLTARLSAVLDGAAPGRAPVTVLEREPNPFASTFPSEVVVCRTADGETRRLFCKYAAERDHKAHGHRGGVAYEARVYGRVLTPLGVTIPHFHGAVG